MEKAQILIASHELKASVYFWQAFKSFMYIVNSTYYDAHAKRPKEQNVPETKRPKGQNVPRGKMKPIF